MYQTNLYNKAKSGNKKKGNVDECIIKPATQMSQQMKDYKNQSLGQFKKVLELCQFEITNCVNMQLSYCIFEVPQFLIGYPLYDLNECIIFLLRKLQESGYKVTYSFPKSIIIVWHVEETEDDKLNNMFKQLMTNYQISQFSRNQHIDYTNEFFKQSQDQNSNAHNNNHLFIEDKNIKHNDIQHHNTYMPIEKKKYIENWNSNSDKVMKKSVVPAKCIQNEKECDSKNSNVTRHASKTEYPSLPIQSGSTPRKNLINDTKINERNSDIKINSEKFERSEKTKNTQNTL
jgi:hypothetical protein